MMAAPIIWVGLEYGRAYFLSGFPWYYLAHSQFRHLYLIQIADFASSLGISLLIAIVNAMVVDLATLPLFGRSRHGIRLHRAAVRAALPGHMPVGTTLCYGAIRVSTARFHDGPRLALLQSNIEQKHKNKGDGSSDRHRVRRAGRSRAGTPRAARPDRLAGDRVSLRLHHGRPGPRRRRRSKARSVSIAPKLSGKEWLERMESIVDDLHSWTDRAGCRCWWGPSCYDHRQNEWRSSGTTRRSCSCPIFDVIHFYHKMHLVPFGEYFPLDRDAAVAGGTDAVRRRKAPQLELRSQAARRCRWAPIASPSASASKTRFPT